MLAFPLIVPVAGWRNQDSPRHTILYRAHPDGHVEERIIPRLSRPRTPDSPDPIGHWDGLSFLEARRGIAVDPGYTDEHKDVLARVARPAIPESPDAMGRWDESSFLDACREIRLEPREDIDGYGE